MKKKIFISAILFYFISIAWFCYKMIGADNYQKAVLNFGYAVDALPKAKNHDKAKALCDSLLKVSDSLEPGDYFHFNP